MHNICELVYAYMPSHGHEGTNKRPTTKGLPLRLPPEPGHGSIHRGDHNNDTTNNLSLTIYV